jgi:hypothetical protein
VIIILWALKLNQEVRLTKLNKDQVTYNDEIRVANNPNVIPNGGGGIGVISNAGGVKQNFYMKQMAPNRQQIVSEEISEVI